jgi:hypothetical protein
MTEFFSISFGAHNYNLATDWPATISEGQPVRSRQAARANIEGAYTAGGLLGVRKIVISGALACPLPYSAANMRAAWDAFKAAHAPGMPQILMIDNDRYIMAEVVSIAESKWNGLQSRPFEVEFDCADPYWYGATQNSQTLALGANSITTHGTAPCLPIFYVNVAPGFTTGASFSIADSFGNVTTVTPTIFGSYVAESTVENMTSIGFLDTEYSTLGNMSVFSGQFTKLAAGASNIQVSTSGNITLSSISVSWQDRWY